MPIPSGAPSRIANTRLPSSAFFLVFQTEVNRAIPTLLLAVAAAAPGLAAPGSAVAQSPDRLLPDLGLPTFDGVGSPRIGTCNRVSVAVHNGGYRAAQDVVLDVWIRNDGYLEDFEENRKLAVGALSTSACSRIRTATTSPWTTSWFPRVAQRPSRSGVAAARDRDVRPVRHVEDRIDRGWSGPVLALPDRPASHQRQISPGVT